MSHRNGVRGEAGSERLRTADQESCHKGRRTRPFPCCRGHGSGIASRTLASHDDAASVAVAPRSVNERNGSGTLDEISVTFRGVSSVVHRGDRPPRILSPFQKLSPCRESDPGRAARRIGSRQSGKRGMVRAGPGRWCQLTVVVDATEGQTVCSTGPCPRWSG